MVVLVSYHLLLSKNNMEGLDNKDHSHYAYLRHLVYNTEIRELGGALDSSGADIIEKWNSMVDKDMQYPVIRCDSDDEESLSEATENYGKFVDCQVEELKRMMDKVAKPSDKFTIYRTIYYLLNSKGGDYALDFRDNCSDNGFFERLARTIININRENLDTLQELQKE